MQQDSSVNIDMARSMARDSSSMNAITILTMVFLPATFVSGVFNSGVVAASQQPASYNISPLLLPYMYTVVPFTLMVVCLYIFRRRLYWIGNRIHQYRNRSKDIREVDDMA
jgi:Mg2+ and Co2+ transporter CorA